jgi:hypothetical protein
MANYRSNYSSSCLLNAIDVGANILPVGACGNRGRSLFARTRFLLRPAKAVILHFISSKTFQACGSCIFDYDVAGRPVSSGHDEIMSDCRIGEATLEYSGGALGIRLKRAVLGASASVPDLARARRRKQVIRDYKIR